MKKHSQADQLAARLADAANTPLGVVPFTVPPNTESDVGAQTESESAAVRTMPDKERKPRRNRKPRTNAQSADGTEDDTVAISIRPRRELLTRYVLAASERTREAGRVVSAQQIMLEKLEDGP